MQVQVLSIKMNYVSYFYNIFESIIESYNIPILNPVA